VTVRLARAADVERLLEVEHDADQRYREIGMERVADDTSTTFEDVARYVDVERAWVASDDGDRIVGGVRVDLIDGYAHVEQLSVVRSHQGRGIGPALLREVERWASTHRLPALTLTTFREVPWNAPLYAHLGFEVLDEEALSPGLRALRAVEADYGFDPDDRICMRRPVTGRSRSRRRGSCLVLNPCDRSGRARAAD
jgi:GNAT superfamily N-acetyltransferase